VPGRSRAPRLALAFAALVTAVGLVTPARAAACPPGAHVLGKDQWTRIALPAFPAGGATLTGYDVGSLDAKRIVATNGTGVATSGDTGCTWTTASLPASEGTLPDPGLGETGRVLSRSLTQVRTAFGSRRTVWAIGATDLAVHGLPVTEPRVLVSVDAGRTFADRSTGLPQFGRPVAVRGFGDAGAFLLFHTTAPQSDYGVYWSQDGGSHWTAVWTGLDPLTDLDIDPWRGIEVWAWSSAAVYHGTPGKTGLAAVPGIPGPVRTVDVGYSLVDDAKTISVFLESGTTRYVSANGEPFHPAPAPDGVQSVTHGIYDGMLAISSVETNVLVEPPSAKRRWGIDYSPFDVNVGDLRFVPTYERNGFPLFAANPLGLFLRYVPLDFSAPPRPPTPPQPPVDVTVHKVRPPRRVPEIRPARSVVSLRPGQTKRVTYDVVLPPVPTPLDVYFMTDSTGSMSSAIAGVQAGVQDIVDELAATGVDLHFGVADFRDYPEQPNDSTTYPYRQRRKVGPVGSELAEALESITTGGGTTDGNDSALEAMYQAVTGAGRRDPVNGAQLIEPGLDADFRPDALKVILVASDDEMRHGGLNPVYPGPALQTVADTLASHDVHLVGIHVDTNSGNPRADMETLAEATGTLAPKAGLDCDGDGAPDIAGGAPIVCDFDPKAGGSIASAFVGMLAGIRDYAAVDVAVQGPRQVVRPLAPVSFPNVDVKAPHTFHVPVEFRCDAAHAGVDTPVTVAANSRGRVLATALATVRCIAPAEPEVVPPVVIPPLVAAALVPPPPPPPAPVTHVQPNPNPNPNPNPQLNANAGFASQQERQFQVAVAEQDAVPDTDLAFAALAWGAAAAMTAAAGYGAHLARRRSTALSYAYATTPPRRDR
jgi:hypothetical protein